MSTMTGSVAVAVNSSTWGMPNSLAIGGELQVFRAEIVPPFRDAMGLIDDEQRDVHLLEMGTKPLIPETLDRDHQDFQLPALGPSQNAAVLVGREGGIETGGGNLTARQKVDLVFHQGQQRGNHQSHVGQHHGGKLIAKRFSRPRGKDRRGGLAGHDPRDDFSLSRSKGTESKVLLQLRLNHTPSVSTAR